MLSFEQLRKSKINKITMSQEIGEAFIRLALALDQHLPGYIDSYSGPPDWQTQAKAAGPRPLAELAQITSTLATQISQDSTLNVQRKDYLARHVSAMQTSIRLLQGERLSLADEVEQLYDVRPTFVSESIFEEAHRVLDELLPAGDSLGERMTARNQALEISVEQAKQVIPSICEHFRQRSRANFPLPKDEAMELVFVKNQPWGAYNWFLGNGRSRIDINTDLPLRANVLADLLAHEAYPGHHTELSIKEQKLVREAGRQEHRLALINAPSCVVSEGIATCALSIVLPEAEWATWHAEEIFPRVGLAHLNAEREHRIDQAQQKLGGINGNAAFLLHDQKASVEAVSNYLMRYQLTTAAKARKTVEFLSNPLYRSYTFTYSCGKQMLQDLFAAKDNTHHWFNRLLCEAVTPSQIRDWMK